MTRDDVERAKKIIDIIDKINNFLEKLEGENISLSLVVGNDIDFNRLYSEDFPSKNSKKSWLIWRTKIILEGEKSRLEKELEEL